VVGVICAHPLSTPSLHGVAVSFSPVLDEAFKINVAKMRVQLPAKNRDAIKDAIVPVTRLAREVYDRKTKAVGSIHNNDFNSITK